MVRRFVLVAVLAASGAAGIARAEAPPDDYEGGLWVDGHGCVWQRADTAWQPWTDRQGAPVCGYAPTGAGESLTLPANPPAGLWSDLPPLAVEPAAPVPGQAVACDKGEAGPHLVALSNGGYAIWCGQSDGAPGAARRLVVQPPGDAGGAVSGRVEGGQFWTRGQPGAPARAVPGQDPALGALYVQIGLYTRAANADSARARLLAAGLPVGVMRGLRDGRAAQIVLAGPFADEQALRAGLSAVRAAGFDDAYIRR